MRGEKPSGNKNQGRGEDADYQDQMFGQGKNEKPTRGPMQRRSASPSEYNTSGMEEAMGAQADKIHKC